MNTINIISTTGNQFLFPFELIDEGKQEIPFVSGEEESTQVNIDAKFVGSSFYINAGIVKQSEIINPVQSYHNPITLRIYCPFFGPNLYTESGELPFYFLCNVTNATQSVILAQQKIGIGDLLFMDADVNGERFYSYFDIYLTNVNNSTLQIELRVCQGTKESGKFSPGYAIANYNFSYLMNKLAFWQTAQEFYFNKLTFACTCPGFSSAAVFLDALNNCLPTLDIYNSLAKVRYNLLIFDDDNIYIDTTEDVTDDPLNFPVHKYFSGLSALPVELLKTNLKCKCSVFFLDATDAQLFAAYTGTEAVLPEQMKYYISTNPITNISLPDQQMNVYDINMVYKNVNNVVIQQNTISAGKSNFACYQVESADNLTVSATAIKTIGLNLDEFKETTSVFVLNIAERSFTEIGRNANYVIFQVNGLLFGSDITATGKYTLTDAEGSFITSGNYTIE